MSVPETHEDLGAALRAVVFHPWRNLFGLWNWKTAGISAMLRAATFLLTNLRAGKHQALRAMLVEAVFAVFAAGLLGALTQRLRVVHPYRGTAMVVWLALPAALVSAQLGVHHLAGTPHVRTGLIVSFCFAAIASGFTWYSMRRGLMLAGTKATSLIEDLRALPRVILEFLFAAPRALLKEDKL